MLCFDNFVLSVSQILTSKIYFTITAEILAAHWLFFTANICGQTHEFIWDVSTSGSASGQFNSLLSQKKNDISFHESVLLVRLLRINFVITLSKQNSLRIHSTKRARSKFSVEES